MPTVTTSLPRRVHLELQSPAEKAIRDAVAVVESMPADERLTNAVTLLDEARETVADYVDEHPEIGTAPQSGWRPIDDEAKTIDDDVILGRTSDIFRVLAQYDPHPDHEGYPWVAPEGVRYHERAFNRWHRVPAPPTEDATG